LLQMSLLQLSLLPGQPWRLRVFSGSLL